MANFFARGPGNHNSSGRSETPLRTGWLLACLIVVALTAFVQVQVHADFSARSAKTNVQANAQARAPESATGGNAVAGKQIFTFRGCDKCHGSDAQGLSRSQRDDAGPRIGPTRMALPVFIRFVRNPPGLMPQFPAAIVSDAQLADVHAFLQSLAPAPQLDTAAPGNSRTGEQLFKRDGCYQCHGDEGQGSTQTGGSRIGPPQIPFPVFASYVHHPVGNMPPYASKALPDANLSDIYAYLRSRPEPAPAASIPLLNQ